MFKVVVKTVSADGLAQLGRRIFDGDITFKFPKLSFVISYWMLC